MDPVTTPPGQPFIFRRQRIIEWGECDAAGIVYYPRYFEMFDANTNALFRAVTGMDKRRLQRVHDIVGWPMVDSRASFQRPVSYGDEVSISSQVVRFGRSSIELLHRITIGEDRLVAEGHDTRVWVGKHPENPGAIKAKPLPDSFSRLFFSA